jgi:hypothetical protein
MATKRSNRKPLVIGEALRALASVMTIPWPRAEWTTDRERYPNEYAIDAEYFLDEARCRWDELLLDCPDGPPPGDPLEILAGYRTLTINLAVLLEVLEADGWYRPGGQATAGQTSGQLRRSVRDARRALIKGILQGLPPFNQRHPTALQTIERVCEELWILGTSEQADASPVLRTCREVKPSTVAADLRWVSRKQK